MAPQSATPRVVMLFFAIFDRDSFARGQPLVM